MAGVLLARAAGKQQSRRAAAVLGPRAATCCFLAPLERCRVAAATILPATTRASTSPPVLPPTHQRLRCFSAPPPPLDACAIAAAILPATTRASTSPPVVPPTHQRGGIVPALERCPIAVAVLPAARAWIPSPVVVPPTIQRSGGIVAALLPTGFHDHVRVRGMEANSIAAGAAAAARVRPAYLLLGNDDISGAAGAMVRLPAPRAYFLLAPTPQGSIIAPLLSAGEADRAAVGAAAMVRPYDDIGAAGAVVRRPAPPANFLLAPTPQGLIAAPLLISTGEADRATAGTALYLPRPVLANPSATGAKGGGFLFGHRHPHETDGVQGAGATGAKGGGFLFGRRDPHETDGVLEEGDYGAHTTLNLTCDYRGAMLCIEHAALNVKAGYGGVLLCVQAAALNPTGNYGGAMLRVQPAALNPTGNYGGAASNLSRLFFAPFAVGSGRRGYSTGKKPRGAGNKIMTKLAKIQLHIQRLERIALNHVKISISHRFQMKLNTRQLKKQVRLLPFWFVGWILVGITFASYIFVEVVVPRVAEIASQEFIALARELKDVANEVDEDKIMKMAAKLTTVITKTVVDYIGGRVKTSILDTLKFWKWGSSK